MSRLLSFRDRDSVESVGIMSDQIAAFKPSGKGYEVFLKGGGSVTIDGGHYYWKMLTNAMCGEYKEKEE